MTKARHRVHRRPIRSATNIPEDITVKYFVQMYLCEQHAEELEAAATGAGDSKLVTILSKRPDGEFMCDEFDSQCEKAAACIAKTAVLPLFLNIRAAAAGGRVKSDAKTESARKNGIKGGRPRVYCSCDGTKALKNDGSGIKLARGPHNCFICAKCNLEVKGYDSTAEAKVNNGPSQILCPAHLELVEARVGRTVTTLEVQEPVSGLRADECDECQREARYPKRKCCCCGRSVTLRETLENGLGVCCIGKKNALDGVYDIIETEEDGGGFYAELSGSLQQQALCKKEGREWRGTEFSPTFKTREEAARWARQNEATKPMWWDTELT